MRIREPKTTALIFASGKMVVTGAKSEDDSKLASRKYARIIQKLGFNAKFTDFKIQNSMLDALLQLYGIANRSHSCRFLRCQIPNPVGGSCIQASQLLKLRA